ncbi:hypothetical protein NW762_003286 [Fusarium torreyae]|uniref:Uncharacterized protein n=1 Tax=Fusarium torreyae TaxID=1237075 RepID=A0A9W8VKW9_9HYPO|nr:hypothetical protein NW762_003286 [Fusarium torreyae]
MDSSRPAPRPAPREAYNELDGKIHALTKEPLLYQQCDVVGVVGHVRGSALDLDEAIQDMANFITRENKEREKKVLDVRQVEAYADTLTARNTVRLPAKCDMLTIISRVAFAGSEPVTIDLSASSGKMTILLYCAQPVSSVRFRIQFPNTSSHEDVDLNPAEAVKGHRYWGLSLKPGASTVKSFSDIGLMGVLFDNSTRSVMDVIQENGKFNEMGWDKYNSNLCRLLNYQLLLANKIHDEDRGLAYQIAEYVASICQGIPKAFAWYSQARVLTASKVFGEKAFMTALVPKLDLSMAQQVLNCRLESVDAFDQAYRNLRMEDASSKNVQLFASLALGKSVDSDRVYSFMSKTAEDRLRGSQTAFNKAQREFNSLQLDLKNKQDDFKAGIEEWKSDKTKEIIGSVFTAVVAVAGGIALACAAPPAAAAGIGAGAEELGSAIQAASKVASLWEEIGSIIDMIKEIYEKLEPYLEKIKELVAAVSQIADLAKSKTFMDDFNNREIQGIKLPSIQSDDSVNVTADWDVFQLQMDRLHNGIESENIGGADEFFFLISKMVIRGKAIFTAQIALTSASDAYLTVTQQRIAQQNNTNRLRKAIPQIQGSDETLSIVKVVLAERVLAVRSWVVLDFRQYVASYAWDYLKPSQPIVVDPMKDIAAFRNDAATLQALAAQVPPAVRAQQRLFSFTSSAATSTLEEGTGNPMVHIPDFLDVLKATRTASFTLDCEHPTFQRYGRLRVRIARIYLDGINDTEDKLISLRVTLGTAMKDLARENLQEKMGTSEGGVAPRVLDFVTTESTFGFEYLSRSKSIVMDGEFIGNQKSSLLLSPFRTWTFTVDSLSDLELISSVRLELVCEVTYV